MGTVGMFILGCILLALVVSLLSRWAIFVIGAMTLASVAFNLSILFTSIITFLILLIVALFKVAIKNSYY